MATSCLIIPNDRFFYFCSVIIPLKTSLFNVFGAGANKSRFYWPRTKGLRRAAQWEGGKEDKFYNRCKTPILWHLFLHPQNKGVPRDKEPDESEQPKPKPD
jgi:hypothetical protein